MRKTTKSIIIAGVGTVLSLGVILGTGSFDLDVMARTSGIARTKVEVDTSHYESPEELANRTQERVDAEANAQRQAIVAEGSKVENRTVDGVTSEVKGLYLLDEIKGLAMAPSKEYYKAESNTTDPSHVEITAYETDAKKSPQAYQCVTEVATQQYPNAVIGPSVNVQYKWPAGEEDSNFVGTFKFGISDSLKKDGGKYAVVSIYPGGFYQIYKDTDDNPDTITIDALGNAQGNLAMYTLIRID
ncbi:hypothetical protein D6855_05730 [Butyrivibrio sp. CB08]|uniref:hypothetical protein n=1 Tax=Butyrivibrio sp. CB08 TaxID=2364879 RepID=UPI000EA9C257|nr:hypothetical protein [Butyrivibrio sp. CB08]RKM61391.1 hypothetical protein D6855_05730 [Butyrivibrio sp. CB08]